MTTYGITPQGFVQKTQQNIIDEIVSDELTGIADDLDVSSDQPIGQLNGIFGRQIGICWEQLAICYNSMDPEAAEGRLLEMLCKLTGTYRQGDTASVVKLLCTLKNGTTLTNGAQYANTAGHPDVRWTPSLDTYPSGYTAGADGQFLLDFVAEFTGPIEGFAGTISEINTPTTGWDGVVNPNDAVLGLRTDLDPMLRQRREAELATIGSATVRAITANISQAFGSKIQQLTVFENEGDNVDLNGLKPHSVEVLIFDGVIPAVADNDLAQVIMDSKAGGISTSGNTAASATALVNGIESTLPIWFSRAAQVPIYVTVNLIKKIGLPYLGDAAVADFIATQGNVFFQPGDYIITERIGAFALACLGVKDLASVYIGLSASPASSANLPITIRQVGRFDTARIVVVSA